MPAQRRRPARAAKTKEPAATAKEPQPDRNSGSGPRERRKCDDRAEQTNKTGRRKKKSPKPASAPASQRRIQQLRKALGDNEQLCTLSGVPKDYTFVPKGDVYVTRRCRTLTQSLAKPFFVVYDAANGRRTGLACPTEVASAAAHDATATQTARAAAVLAADARAMRRARVALEAEFPSIPSAAAAAVLQHAFAKRSGRVGRTATLDDNRKARLAVRAHVRHTLTPYDNLLAGSSPLSRVEARKRVEPTVRKVVAEWGKKGSGVEAESGGSEEDDSESEEAA